MQRSPWLALSLFTLVPTLPAAELPLVSDVELQPLAAQVRRVIEATEYLGSPLSAADKRRLEAAFGQADAAAAVGEIQRVLDPHCLFGVNINPESRVKVAAGPARPGGLRHWASDQRLISSS